ncbi:hypothetical protein [Sulfurospirillum cavolei]|uniref:hypothetical protein n=1 Tax=Sulfurospirillum cavolei TaxID=366522 RepID=UPI003FA219C0
MKFTITVNQKQAKDLGITNINQAIILGFISEAHSWAEPVVLEGEVYYWAARSKIAEELELLDLKDDTIYRHLKSLVSLGLLDYIKINKKDCVRLTKKGKTYYVGNESEKGNNSDLNPTKLGNESENNSDLNPTYKNTKEHKSTKDKSSVATVCDDAHEIASYLLQKIQKHQPSFKVQNLQAWVRDIDLALRVDGRTKEQLIWCINWIYGTQRGNFWIANVLSGKKLREKFNTMQMQSMQKETKHNTNDVVDAIYGQGATAQELIEQMERGA